MFVCRDLFLSRTMRTVRTFPSCPFLDHAQIIGFAVFADKPSGFIGEGRNVIRGKIIFQGIPFRRGVRVFRTEGFTYRATLISPDPLGGGRLEPMPGRADPMIAHVAHKADRIGVDVSIGFRIPFGKQLRPHMKERVLFLPAIGTGRCGGNLFSNRPLPFVTFGAFPFYGL